MTAILISDSSLNWEAPANLPTITPSPLEDPAAWTLECNEDPFDNFEDDDFDDEFDDDFEEEWDTDPLVDGYDDDFDFTIPAKKPEGVDKSDKNGKADKAKDSDKAQNKSKEKKGADQNDDTKK